MAVALLGLGAIAHATLAGPLLAGAIARRLDRAGFLLEVDGARSSLPGRFEFRGVTLSESEGRFRVRSEVTHLRFDLGEWLAGRIHVETLTAEGVELEIGGESASGAPELPARTRTPALGAAAPRARLPSEISVGRLSATLERVTFRELVLEGRAKFDGTAFAFAPDGASGNLSSRDLRFQVRRHGVPSASGELEGAFEVELAPGSGSARLDGALPSLERASFELRGHLADAGAWTSDTPLSGLSASEPRFELDARAPPGKDLELTLSASATRLGYRHATSDSVLLLNEAKLTLVTARRGALKLTLIAKTAESETDDAEGHFDAPRVDWRWPDLQALVSLDTQGTLRVESPRARITAWDRTFEGPISLRATLAKPPPDTALYAKQGLIQSKALRVSRAESPAASSPPMRGRFSLGEARLTPAGLRLTGDVSLEGADGAALLDFAGLDGPARLMLAALEKRPFQLTARAERSPKSLFLESIELESAAASVAGVALLDGAEQAAFLVRRGRMTLGLSTSPGSGWQMELGARPTFLDRRRAAMARAAR